MRIDPKKCVACGNCVAVCPMGAIYIDPTIGVRKMIDRVKEGRRTPKQACQYFSRFCLCGIFNPPH